MVDVGIAGAAGQSLLSNAGKILSADLKAVRAQNIAAKEERVAAKTAGAVAGI